jgi:hypothetical protein
MTITAKVSTILKARNLPSEQLEPHEKINILKGAILQVSKITPAPHQHLALELIESEFDRGFVYAPHWDYKPTKIVLPAKYYYQTDNPSGYGYRECNGTSNAIMLNYLLNGQLDATAAKNKIAQPESIYLDVLKRYGDTTDHNANTEALNQFGIDSYWSTSLTFDDYYLSIRNSIPMVLGLDYKTAGHIVCGVGFELRDKIIVHDPFGAREGTTDYWLSNLPEAGKLDVYSIASMTKLWLVGGSGGWGRVVTRIDGIPTVFAR